ncbi:matrixin family metalloprotease [Nostocoides sp. Soil756]|jgi:hypothetical protein|uniref:matrixin family metalloprotease n=1 Tax=Nostocoides sp. Soil756 TaxID=1736399 RepID=UPI000A8C1001|nr:matrixin family metalloprotease [Tetrasphaera sp. Soil756]
MTSALPRARALVGGAAAVATCLTALAATSLPASAAPVGSGAPAAACALPSSGALTTRQLPAGASATACRAVGRVVTVGGVGLTVPEPGMAAGVEALRADGGHAGFQIEVSKDGRISYPQAVTVASPAVAAASPSACSDGAYTTNDLKEYGTYNWYIGDGGMPGALSRSEAQAAFADAINNITGSYNNCGYSDTVDAKSAYQGTTTYESDMSSTGACTDRDGKSTWDAGNLESGTVAQTCWWSTPTPGLKNDLVEADVRYNTTDYDFTNSPTSTCSNKYDIRSVGTHEAGHVFGMGHVGSGHSELTMYTNSFTCTTKARTLGKGDVAGLRSIY